MLNRMQLLHALSGITNTLQNEYKKAAEIAHAVWQTIVTDDQFLAKVQRIDTPWAIPTWCAALDTSTPVTRITTPYVIMSVDGSQVYPDRHQGTNCYLINIGSVVIAYGAPKPVTLTSQPFVFTERDAAEYEGAQNHEMINCHRQELELIAGRALAQAYPHQTHPRLLLFDGSLIFWNLEAKHSSLSELFLQNYLQTLDQLYWTGTPYAGYISVPRSREITNIIKLALCNCNTDDKDLYAPINPIVDTTICSWFLEPYTRSTIFCNRTAISRQYPAHLQPHFFYLHVGTEIGRVEIPQWIAYDESLVDQIAGMIIDQCAKGNGYPIVLAEAHEQAVIKGPDREFFYLALRKEGLQTQTSVRMSPKEQRKRCMGV